LDSRKSRRIAVAPKSDYPHGTELEEVVRMLGTRARPEPGWVAQVVGCDLKTAQWAIDEVVESRAVVSELCKNILRTGRTFYAQFPAPLELYAMVRLGRPSILVESGVSSGVSSTFLLLGVAANKRGTLHSIDLPVPRLDRKPNESWSIPAGLSSGWAVPAGLKRDWDLLLGRSEDMLQPLLRRLGFVDLYCHDSPVDADHLEFEIGAVSKRLRPGSIVVADNTGANREAFAAAAESVGTNPIHRRQSELAAFRVPLA
jgi:hypothetical protein